MSAATSYSALEKKYGYFRAPSLEVKVGSTRLVRGEGANIRSLELELTSGYEASGCVFYVDGAYEVKNTDFKKYIDKLQIGEKVEVEVGYVKRESVFTGYINQIEYQYGADDGSYRVRVECMDAKGLLMKTRRMEFFNKKNADGIVSAVLGEQPVSSYLSGKEIDACKEEDTVIRSHMMTDYELITEQASKQGYEFFIIQGKAYFRKKQKVTSSIMKLSPGEGILNARFMISGQQLVKKIEVRSIDETSGKLISGEVTISGSFSSGSSANKLMGTSKQVYYEPGVKDAAEAKARAQARMDSVQEKFGEIECECIGIPELAPGRFVEVDKLSAQGNGKYYITYVRHLLNEDGYHTFFRAGVNSL